MLRWHLVSDCTNYPIFLRLIFIIVDDNLQLMITNILGMNLLGSDYNIVARQCMEGLGALGGKCIGTEVPGQGGKSVQAQMCLCNSDQCNAASFPIQATFITIFVSIASILLQKLI